MQHLLTLVVLKVKEIAEKLGLIADYVIEQGTSGSWTYRKWNSGIAECWRYWNGSKSLSATFAGWYYYSGAFNLPNDLFATVKYASVNARQGTGLTFANVNTFNKTAVYFQVISSQYSGDAWQNIYVLGQWK